MQLADPFVLYLISFSFLHPLQWFFSLWYPKQSEQFIPQGAISDGDIFSIVRLYQRVYNGGYGKWKENICIHR